MWKCLVKDLASTKYYYPPREHTINIILVHPFTNDNRTVLPRHSSIIEFSWQCIWQRTTWPAVLLINCNLTSSIHVSSKGYHVIPKHILLYCTLQIIIFCYTCLYTSYILSRFIQNICPNYGRNLIKIFR